MKNVVLWDSDFKRSLLVICKILWVFVNTMNGDDKYHLRNCENLRLTTQTQLSKKQKYFSEFFVPFLKSTSNFEHFEQKGSSS